MPEHVNLGKLARETDHNRSVGQIVRPAAGWLRPLREALGVTLADLAKRLKVTPPAVRSFEQAEAEDRITLASLRRAAAAMSCELVYVLVPRTGTLTMLAETESRSRASTAASPPVSPPEVALADDASKKVIDKTWRAQHDES